MSREHGPSPEEMGLNVLKLDSTEWNAIRSIPREKLQDPETIQMLEEKGIKLNGDPVEIEVDGVKKKMVTLESDFGTTIDE